MLKDTRYIATPTILEEAIRERLLLDIVYFSDAGTYETLRRIQPATFGRRGGVLYLRALHMYGQSFSVPFGRGLWRLFMFSRIVDVVLEGGRFTNNPPGYVRGDSFFDQIREQL